MNLLAFAFILSLMMVVHELGHFITARLFKITVLEFGLGLPPRAVGIRHAGIIYSLNWIPFGAFVKMLGEEDPSAPGSFASKPRLVRAIVLAAGPGMNFLLAVLAFTIASLVGVPTPSQDGPVRFGGISEDSPASHAGLREGDTVVTFNGQPVSGGQQFRDFTREHLGQPVEIVVRRPEGDVAVTVVPRTSPPPGQGAIGVRLAVQTRIVRYPLHEAIGHGLDQTVRSVGITFLVPKWLIEGVISPADARPVGLVGMAQMTSQTVDDVVDSGFWYPLFVLVGMFSAGLAVANMLPIPALDGGRLFFILIESLRGRRVSPQREAAFHFAGIVLLLTLMLVISVNDVISPIPRINWGVR